MEIDRYQKLADALAEVYNHLTEVQFVEVLKRTPFSDYVQGDLRGTVWECGHTDHLLAGGYIVRGSSEEWEIDFFLPAPKVTSSKVKGCVLHVEDTTPTGLEEVYS